MMKENLSTRQWIALGITVPASLFLLYLLFKRRDDDHEDNYRPSKEVAKAQQLTIEMKVPYDKVGQVIGQQGVQIKQIQEETSCRVKFQNETGLDDKEDRLLVIRGTPDNALCAEQHIRKIINAESAIQTLEMMIPQWAIGKIIGRNGENIRSLCRASKARIRIERDDDRSDLNAKRLCTIKGTEDQIRYAQGFIEEDIANQEEYQRKLENASASRKQRGSSRSQKSGMPPDQRQQIESGETERGTTDKSITDDDTVQIPTSQDYFSVYVSAVEHMGHFWVQILGSKSGALDLVVQNMTEYYSIASNQQMYTPDTLCTGDIIAAPFHEDESWYRARILGFFEDGLVDLYYVDFGDSDKMPRSSICSLRSDFLSLPHQAVECCLAGIESVDSEWSEEAVDTFEDVTFCAKWRPLMAKIVTYQQTDSGTLPCVELVDTSNTKDVSIAAVLVERGYAKFTHQTRTRLPQSSGTPRTDNGSAHPPEGTLPVPPEFGESDDDDEEEMFLGGPVRTG